MFGFVTKEMFFDRDKVRRKTDSAARRVLGKFGAFVRRAARSSIRKRKRTSALGEPPSSHTGLLRKFIFFGYDRADRTVVIGPIPLRAKAEAPELLEHGGRVHRKVGKRRRRTMTYRPRPFMGPAFEINKPKLPAMWKDSVA